MGVDVPVVDKPGHGRLRRRRNILLAIVALAVIASVGGLLVSTTIKSPAEQAAETAAPGLTRLTAPVQYTVIHNIVQAHSLSCRKLLPRGSDRRPPPFSLATAALHVSAWRRAIRPGSRISAPAIETSQACQMLPRQC